MRSFVLGLLAGAWILQQQAGLPPAWLVPAAFGAAAFCVLVLRHPGSRGWPAIVLLLLAGAATGFGWATWRAELRLSDALAPELEGRDVLVTGVVASLPQQLERGVRFRFDVESAVPGVPSRLSLAWYRGRQDEEASTAVPVRAGERWQFVVRLKRPHGSLNPHGFDFEAWLFERGERATGYVRPRPAPSIGQEPKRLDDLVPRPGYLVERLRERIRDRMALYLPGESHPYAGILLALAIGDQQAVDGELWAVFARTGITHLMSISGLHVTMFGGLAYALAAFAWRRSRRLPLRIATPRVAALAGFAGAFAYALIAGFAIPAQRTLYMLGVVSLALAAGRELAASRVLAVALLAVLAADPWAVFSPGFWLSFGAVAILFLAGAGRLGARHWLREGLRTQWAITLASLPALLALFQQFSLVSPLANALAIPAVGLAITPLALLGSVPGFDAAWQFGHVLTVAMMAGIEWLAGLPWAVWQQAAPPAWAVIVALAGAVWMLLPRGIPGRWLGLVCFLPLLTAQPPRPPHGQLEVTVLDVGQGLAVHLRTAGSDLLFDAGPAYSVDSDSGNRVIVPYLRAIGTRRIDALMISHSDRDHEGGARSVLTLMPVTRLISSLRFEHALSAEPLLQEKCAAGHGWTQDGVSFEFLHPPPGADSARANALSCVLRVEAGGQRLLLTGDIETREEAALVASSDLAADVVVVPHHGSRGSSSPAFVAATRARAAIFTAGYRNRFGHPHTEVVERWSAAGAAIHRTDHDGALRVVLGVSPDDLLIRHERAERRRYWHGR